MNMRLETPEAAERPAAALGGPGATSVDDRVTSTVLDDEDLRIERARRLRPWRGHDYRLKGLELGSEQARLANKYTPLRRRRRRLVIKWVMVLAVAALGASLFRASLVQPFSVPSAAMIPTLRAGDRVLVVKPSRLAGKLNSGDVVVFHRPSYFPCSTAQRGEASDLVARVIAVPGETVWSAGNKIFVDGRLLREKGWYDQKYGPVRVGTDPAHQGPAGQVLRHGRQPVRLVRLPRIRHDRGKLGRGQGVRHRRPRPSLVRPLLLEPVASVSGPGEEFRVVPSCGGTSGR